MVGNLEADQRQQQGPSSLMMQCLVSDNSKRVYLLGISKEKK
jgi:hypothetical protein